MSLFVKIATPIPVVKPVAFLPPCATGFVRVDGGTPHAAIEFFPNPIAEPVLPERSSPASLAGAEMKGEYQQSDQSQNYGDFQELLQLPEVQNYV